MHFAIKEYQLIEQIDFKTEKECLETLRINITER